MGWTAPLVSEWTTLEISIQPMRVHILTSSGGTVTHISSWFTVRKFDAAKTDTVNSSLPKCTHFDVKFKKLYGHA